MEPKEFQKEQLKQLKNISVYIRWILALMLVGIIITAIIYVKTSKLFG